MKIQIFMRAVAAAAILLATAAVCILLQVVSGQTNAGTTTVASIAALGGLLWTQRVVPGRRGGPRILLGVAAGLATALLMGLPMPPQSTNDRLSAAILAAAILMSAAAWILVERRPRIARGLVAVLALYGAVMLVAAVRLTMGQMRQDGPAATLSRSFVILLATSWLAASWSLRLRRPKAGAHAYADAAILGPSGGPQGT